MRNICTCILVFWTLFCALNINCFAQNQNAASSKFFEERYRGWLWFEEKVDADIDNENKLNTVVKTDESIPIFSDMEKAKEENEAFAKKLDLFKHMMVRYPDNLKYVENYKKLEKIMLDRSIILASTVGMVNFLNPEIVDQLKSPQNIFGRQVARRLQAQNNAAIINNLASKIELFVLRQSSCPHSELLEKHLASFGLKYGFKIEAISIDQTNSKFFKTYNDPQITAPLLAKLDLKVTPSVIAVTIDSDARFELARGAVSIADLEEKALLLAKYLEQSGALNEQNINQRQKASQ
jgi:conjugal transfer pilus assembly protein TraF